MYSPFVCLIVDDIVDMSPPLVEEGKNYTKSTNWKSISIKHNNGAPNEELKKTSPNITSNASPPMGDMLSPVVVSMEIQQQLEENKRLRNEIKKVRMQGMQGNMTQVQMQGNTTKAKMIIIEDDRLQKAKETDLVQENAY